MKKVITNNLEFIGAIALFAIIFILANCTFISTLAF